MTVDLEPADVDGGGGDEWVRSMTSCARAGAPRSSSSNRPSQPLKKSDSGYDSGVGGRAGSTSVSVVWAWTGSIGEEGQKMDEVGGVCGGDDGPGGSEA